MIALGGAAAPAPTAPTRPLHRRAVPARAVPKHANSRRRTRRLVVSQAPAVSASAGGGGAPFTTAAVATTTTTTTTTTFSRARTLSRQQQLHPSLLRPLSAEQRRWLAALGISDATIARHGIAAQTVAHPLLQRGGNGDDDDDDDSSSTTVVDAVAIPYYQSGRLVDARYYVLAPAFRPEDEGGDDDDGNATPLAAAEAAGGLVVAASWMARGGRALYVAGAGALGGSEALLNATGDVVVVGDELDALAVAEAFEQQQEQLDDDDQQQPQQPPPPQPPTVVAIPQPLPSWRRDAPLYADPRRRLYHLTQQLQRAREEEKRRRDREGLAPPATGAGRRRAQEEGEGNVGNAASTGAGAGSGGMLDYLLPQASSVVFACRASAKGSHAAALNRQRQQWEQRRRQQGGGGDDEQPDPDNPAPDAALDGFAADEALAAEAARLFGEARCKTVQWPQAWTDHWERWQQGGENGGDDESDAESQGDSGLRLGALHMLLADGPLALRLYVTNPREWPIAGLQRFFDYADEIYSAFGDFDENDESGDGSGSSSRSRQPLAYSTGWPSLDAYYRVAPGEVTLVTGVPNSGKSEWLDALAVNLAEAHGWRFALCSMEKRASDHARQLLEKRARRPMLKGAAYATARGGTVPRMTEEELVAAFRWLDHHFVVLEAAGGGDGGGDDDDDDGGSGGGFSGGAPTLDWILDRARAAVAKYGVRGLIIDPYNEIDHATARFGNGSRGAPALLEHEHVASVMSSLRRFAQRHGVHVWLVAHPRQMPAWTGQAPTLMDVSGGANFMAKADNGVIVHRDWSRVAKELATRPDGAGAVGGGGGNGTGGLGGGRRSKAAKSAGEGEAGASGEEGGAAAKAASREQQRLAQEAEDEAAARRANFGVRIILAKVRNKTSGQRGEAALEYDPVTGRYAEPSWFGGVGVGGGVGGENGHGGADDAPPPWAGDPLSFVVSPVAADSAVVPSSPLHASAAADSPPLSEGGECQQGQAAPPERIQLSGGAYAEVSAHDAAAAAAAYDALLEAQLDEWETAAGPGRVVEEVDWRVNTSGGGGGGGGFGGDDNEPVDFDAWTFEQ